MEKVLIVDCGSQYTGLIARRIREAGVFSEILPATLPKWNSRLDAGVKGVIVSGGPGSALQLDHFPLLGHLGELTCPLLGICFGFHWMAQVEGGKLTSSHRVREYGLAEVNLKKKNLLFHRVPAKIKVWMSHGDSVVHLPPSFEVLGSTSHHIAAFAHQKRPWYGVQFHPEVHHSQFGKEILQNFLFRICSLSSSWSPETQVEEIVRDLQKQVGKGGILQATSGGVDSTVASILLEKALPGQTRFITVDTGLLREGESEYVVESFQRNFSIPVNLINYGPQILKGLRGVTDPEKKRKIIGHAFIEAFEEDLKAHPKIKYLGQGTLYPDVIESVSVVGPSHTIKSHHNVGGLPENMKLKLVEPLRMLYKDEVRRLGRYLGISDEMLDRQPFPGPGLAIRIIGAVTDKKLKILREAHKIVDEESIKSKDYSKIWQGFPVLLNTRTVGVKGDKRSYDAVIALRIVESQDGMTSRWLPLENKIMERIMSRICNEVSGVGRVVLDLTSKPPGTIEWE